MKDSTKHWRISAWRHTRKMNYLRPLAAGAWEAVGDLDHLGVRQPIKGIKNSAGKQSSLFVWNPSTQVGAQALSLSQRVMWEEAGVCRTKERGWKWAQGVHNEWPGPLCSHPTRPAQSQGFSQVWNVSHSLNLKKTIINPQNYLALLSNRIPSTIFLPFLSRLQVGPFGGFPCSFQRCTRWLHLYFSYTT